MSNTAATLELLPPLLGSFLARHPTVDVELDERPSPEIARAVAAGRADLGIVADVVDAAAELETGPLADDRLVLVTPAGHPLAKRRRVAFQEILDLDFVGLAGRALQSHIDDQAARSGRRLKVRVTMPSFDAVCCVVERGIGVAVVSEPAARRCRRSMRIGMVSLTDPWAFRRLRLCARSFSALPLHARALVEHFGQSL
jgi:DNA-binding transcriptional LysR family regulator